MRSLGSGGGNSILRAKPPWWLFILVVLAAGTLAASFKDAQMPPAQGDAIRISIAKAKALCDEGRFQEALTLLDQAVKTAAVKPEQDELRTALADTHISWAANLLKNAKNEAAIEQYKAAFDIDKEIRPKSASLDLDKIGTVYFHLGEKQKALDCYEQALPILRVIGDRPNEATTLNNIGFLYSDIGKKQKALEYYEQALPILRALGDRANEATTLTDIGGVHSGLGQRVDSQG